MHSYYRFVVAFLTTLTMGITQSTLPNSLLGCLESTIPANLVTSPSNLDYYLTDVKPYNLNIKVTPLAVTFPQTVAHVQSAVKCAGQYGAKVQAKGGGHSYGNYGRWQFCNERTALMGG
jgi:hypothetical protein